MSGERVVVFDTETSGLDPAKHEIIQFAAIACDGEWRPVEELELKMSFDLTAAEPQALELNSFEPVAWAGAPHPREAVATIGAFLRRHATFAKTSKAGKPYRVARLAAHNARFDCDFLAALFKRWDAFCPAAICEPLDTLALCRWATLGAARPPKDHKLETMCAYFGVPTLGAAHDALEDVRRTANLAALLMSFLTTRPAS